MADATKTPVNYILTDKAKGAIAAYAALVAETHRAKCRVTDPKMEPTTRDAQCEEQKRKAMTELTEHAESTIKDLNKTVNEEAAKGKKVGVRIGESGIRIVLESQENVDQVIKAIIETEYAAHARDEKAYYDAHLEMRDRLEQRETRRQEEKAAPLDFSDLDMARLHKLNRDIAEAGEQIGIPAAKLAADGHDYEVKMLEGRLRRTGLWQDDARRIIEDKEMLAKARAALSKTQTVWVAEQAKKEAEAKKAAAPAETLPAAPEMLPPPQKTSPDAPPPQPPPMEAAIREMKPLLAWVNDLPSGFPSEHIPFASEELGDTPPKTPSLARLAVARLPNA